METHYLKVSQHEEYKENFEEELRTSQKKARWCKASRFGALSIAFVCGALSVVAISVIKGFYHTELDILRPLGDFPLFFEANETFAAFPSTRSNKAWSDQKPNGVGFIQHPTLGPEIFSIAVFHQLHCLDALRSLIYKSKYNGVDPGETPWHVTHCLEYLRNVLLCHADPNLEYTQHSLEETGSMAGFDFHKPHMCRDYSKVFNFAEKWRVYDGKERSERRPIKDKGGRVINYIDLGEQ